jgi:hypothetical protein
MDLDAAGAVAHGGLIAEAVDRPAGQAGEAQHACTDCGAEIVGRFCHECGQPAHLHRTLVHLGEELLHGVMHFDSRVWRTLPLLAFRPGQLTREWVHGRRTRYVSPLALFLFTVFVMFMGLSYMPVEAEKTAVGKQVAAAADLARKNTALATAEAELENAATPEARAAAKEKVAELQEQADEASERMGDLSEAVQVTNWKEDLAADVKSGEMKVNTGDKKLDAKIRHKLENPELALYKLQQAFYKFSFLLVPISIPFVALLFLWKRGFTLYDHGVFVLYSLTFMSILVMGAAVATRIGGITSALVWLTVPFAVPAHMFFQLKGAYGLGTFSAAWRTWFLLWFCAIALGLFVAAVTMLSA